MAISELPCNIGISLASYPNPQPVHVTCTELADHSAGSDHPGVTKLFEPELPHGC